MNVHGLSPLARWGVGLAFGSVLVLSGCGKEATPGVASVAPQAAGAAAADGGVKDELAAYIKGRKAWVDCMGKNGIDLPDPDERGDVKKDLSKSDPKVSKAATACRALYTEPSAELTEYLTPVATPDQMAANKSFAECMRKNGVTKFPDPDPDGKDGPPPIVGPDGESPAYLKAQAVCFKLPEVAKAYPGWSPDMESVG